MKFTTRLLAATILAAGFAGAAEAKTLVYCSEGSPEGFDPAPYTAGTTHDVTTATHNGLTRFEHGTTKVVPALAEAWEISGDGKEYTFFLRKGVKFHTTDYFTPTRDLNADDVIYSFKRQNDKNDPWYSYAGGSWEYWAGMDMPALVKDIVKVDDYTVKLVLNEPNAPMLANLAMPFANILSKEYADKLVADGKQADLNQAPIGTGPFKFVAYQKDAVIRFQANADYWGGKPAIDDLVFAITPDASVRIQKLKAGECQAAPYPNPADIEGLKADANIQVLEQAGLNVGYLAYNALKKPFDDVRVRKALNMAINKQAILDAVYQGAGQIATNPIPPTMWSYNDAVADDPYDPEAAKKALEEAGVKDLTLKVWAMPVSRPYNPNARRMAELIQSDFDKVGVKVEIVSYEWGEYLKRSQDKERDGAVLLGWTGDNGDPDNFLGVLLGCAGVGGSNRSNWCDPKFDEIIKKARATADIAERTKLYEEAQVVFKEQAPWATIAHSTTFMPLAKSVTGYTVDPFGLHHFDNVDITE